MDLEARNQQLLADNRRLAAMYDELRQQLSSSGSGSAVTEAFAVAEKLADDATEMQMMIQEAAQSIKKDKISLSQV